MEGFSTIPELLAAKTHMACDPAPHLHFGTAVDGVVWKLSRLNGLRAGLLYLLLPKINLLQNPHPF